MWLQFTRRTCCQIPFIYNPKTCSKVWLLRMIKNMKIYLVQLAARPFPKHIYRILRALLNSTLTRNEIESLQTMYLYFRHPKLDKPILLYKLRYFSIWNLTSSIQNHTPNSFHIIIPSSVQLFIVPYSNLVVPYNPRHVSIQNHIAILFYTKS